MSMQQPLRDRRSEPRRYCCAKRISWSTPSAERGTHGWLNDISTSGLGFLTHRFFHPEVGDEIDVVTDDDRVRCRVLHVRPADSTFSLVGCRRITRDEVVDDRTPQPSIVRRCTGVCRNAEAGLCRAA